MEIITKYLTTNPCYISGRTIKVKGLMLHSVGCPQPNPKVFVDVFANNKNACVHGFLGEDECYITLPCIETRGTAHRGWHAGEGSKGSANNTHISIEMCEPSCIKYTGGSTFTCSNKQKAVEFVEKVTQNAVELFADLCDYHGLNPLEDGVIISHAEGHQRGIACNHGDPDHLWKQLGMNWDMDRFRYEVHKKVEEDKNMTLDKFKELWLEMRKELQDNDCDAWSKDGRDFCINNGIINGSGTINGEPNYMYHDFLTREQMMVILKRYYDTFGG